MAHRTTNAVRLAWDIANGSPTGLMRWPVIVEVALLMLIVGGCQASTKIDGATSAAERTTDGGYTKVRFIRYGKDNQPPEPKP